MTIFTLLLITLTVALTASIVLNYIQKHKIGKTLHLLAMKKQNIMLAIRSGNIAVWGYDVKQGHLYNVEGEVFAKNGATIAEAMADVHPDDYEYFANILQDVVCGKLPEKTVCIRFKNTKTGQWEYVEKEFAVIKSQSGEVETVIGTHKDVTSRVLEAEKIEELLKKYQQLYNENQTILNSLPTGVSIYDREGKLFYINQTMSNMMGIKDTQLFVNADNYIWNNPFLEENIKQQVVEGKNTVFCYQADCNKLPDKYFNPTDKTIFISCVFSVVRNEHGEIESYVFIHRDVTLEERQKAEMLDMSETLIHVINTSGFSVWEYPIKERKFYSYQSEINMKDGTSYEDVLACHTPESAEQCNTVFHNLTHGITEVEHLIFEIVDQESGHIKFYKCELVARKDNDGNPIKIYGVQKDVTDEQNYQLELEESKLKTQLAIQISDMVQWEYDVNKHIFHTINERWESDILTVEDYYQVTHPDDLQKVREIVELMNSGQNEIFEFDVRFKFPTDRKWQYIKITGTPLKQDKNGKVIKFTGFQRNNTQWHNLTEKLKEKDETNNLILNNMHSGLVYLSPERNVIWENASEKFSQEFANGSPLFEVGKSCHETHLGINKLCETCMLENVWKKKDILAVERTFDNGNILEIVGTPIIDANGDLSGIILRIDDITERKRLYEALEASRNDALSSNQLLREILNRIPGAFFIKDPTNDYRYVMANRVFCEILGKSESDIIGKTDSDIMPPESALIYRRDDEQAMIKQEPMIIEEETRFGGIYHCWKTVKSSFTSINNRQLLISMSVDITEIRKTNEELQKAKNKAEESDKLKSAFLANMSHEIRTPLNAIIGFSELMQTCEDSVEKEEYMRIISTNNELLLRLVNDILDLSKLESGIVQLHDSQFDLSQYFNELSMVMQQRIINPDIKFITENPYKSCIINTDKDRMTQIWLNYMTNAIKYTVSGYIKMGYEYVNEGIRIYVEDSGIGIPDEKKDKLFHRFEKLDSFAQGTGLGLSICKAIAELYGGEVGFESTEGKGSQFWAWKPIKARITYKNDDENVPFSAIESKTDNLDIENYLKAHNLKILITEDNDSNYLLINRIFKNNFQLFRAFNGLEAIEFVKNNPIDLVLMDIKMPVMDGLQATRIIREFNQTIPIIALTANAFDTNRNEALNCGCNDFITKPVRKNELFFAMYRICKNKDIIVNPV